MNFDDFGKPPRHKFYTSINDKRCVENYKGREEYKQKLSRIFENIIFQKTSTYLYSFLQFPLFRYHNSIYGNINVSELLS